MAFTVVVVAALVAMVSAGMDADYMNMMNMMNQHQPMQQQQHQASSGGCNPDAPGGCQLPTGVDMGEYLQQQMQQQQYETNKMAEKVKAQFEAVMREVTMKKHKYAMGVMTEITALCACADSATTIYQTMFVENAKSLNLTDIVDLNDYNMMPYQAKTLKEARELIFGGMVYALCSNLSEYMKFAQQVENAIPIYANNPVPTQATTG